ncbi:MAG: tetratricopeptide repeat protein, partial [Desulfobacterales bacterium]|nr:tetratricopeptide repeat protein [Desulfobacterales bacterium]
MSGKRVNDKTFYNIHWQYLVCLILVLSILAVYFQVRHFEFLVYDDDLYVVENRIVKTGLNQKSFLWAFKSNYAANWHPLTWLSHMLDVQMHGLNSGAHHLTNLFFHVLNTILLFLAFRQITGALWRSAVVAALFALHPLHVESVAQVACRKDLLSTFFWLLTLMCYGWYAMRPCVRRYLAVLIFFTAGLMAKPMVVTLPFVLLLMDYWPLGRFAPKDSLFISEERYTIKILFRLFLEKMPLFIITTASSIVTFIVQSKGGAVESLIKYPFTVRVANAVASYVRYILKMIWPSHLAVFYPHPGMWPFWEVAGAFALLVLVFLLAVRNVKKRPYLIVGWLWYIGTLVPVIGLVQIGSQAMADRYTYIPLIGLFILIAWGAGDLLKRWRLQRGCLSAAGVIIVLLLSIISWRQAGYWQNSIKLFEHAIAVTRDNLTAHNNLGIALVGAKRAAEAIPHYLTVLQKQPNQARVHNNLGNALLSLGKSSQAEQHYSEALRLNPDYARARNNLANVLAGRGKTTEAIQYYLETLAIHPEYTDAHYNLGNVFMARGRFDEAIEQYIAV